jgi:hypothetical protein
MKYPLQRDIFSSKHGPLGPTAGYFLSKAHKNIHTRWSFAPFNPHNHTELCST